MTSLHKVVVLENASDVIIESYSVICAEHHTEKPKAFCVYYLYPLCGICVGFEHRKCENVMKIGKAANGVKQSLKT